MSTIAVTAVTSQLGGHVVDALLAGGTDPSSIVGIARDASRAADLAGRGVEIREADYTDQASYEAALQGVDRVVLISSGDVAGDRGAQHATVIEAAKTAGVSLLAYTSILNADSTEIQLAQAHKDTEAYLATAGLPYVLLRNGWYTENYLGGLDVAIEHGLYGSAGDGKVQPAARADYGAAAAAVISSSDDQAGKVYELAGDTALSLPDVAALIGEAAGKDVAYVNVPVETFTEILVGAGLPAGFAPVIADSHVALSRGELVTDSTDLSDLLGRPTTPARETIAAAVASLTTA